MPNYNLRISLADQDLQRILASWSSVVVAKQNGDGSPVVAWVAFRPLASNSMSWDDSYGIYASNTRLMEGAMLRPMSRTPYPVAAGMSYELVPNGAFAGPQAEEQPGSYGATNSYSKSLAFGLYQNAEVNGSQVRGNAICTAPVLPSGMLSMTPSATIYVWIQSGVVGNSVLGAPAAPRTVVTFGPATDVSLRYDSAAGRFVTAPADLAAADGHSGQHVRHEPAARARARGGAHQARA